MVESHHVSMILNVYTWSTWFGGIFVIFSTAENTLIVIYTSCDYICRFHYRADI